MSEDMKNEEVEEQINNVELENEELVEETEANEEAVLEEDTAEEAPEEVEEPKSPEEVIADLELQVLRTRADFDNFRKRSVRDQEDARQRGKISVLDDVLPVYDTFTMAMQATEMDNANLDMIVQGMNMIQNMFVKSIDDMGVAEINAMGQKFDPNLHEATSESFSEEVEEGMVLSQTRCGYKLGERLLRPAMVVVSKGVEPDVIEEDVADEAEEA